MRRRMYVFSLFTAIALTGPLAVTGAPSAQASTSAADYLVQRLNNARAVHGLARLRVSADLSRYARRHSASMSGQRTLFHTTNFGALCCWSAISENIGYDSSARRVHRVLMNSAPHRANILDPTKGAVGVGIARENGMIWVTQVFRRPR